MDGWMGRDDDDGPRMHAEAGRQRRKGGGGRERRCEGRGGVRIFRGGAGDDGRACHVVGQAVRLCTEGRGRRKGGMSVACPPSSVPST